MPARSMLPAAPARRTSGTTAIAKTNAPTPIGTLMKNIQCQLA